MGLLRVPSAFNNTLGEFPVSGLEHSTDSKLRRRLSWVLQGGRTLPLRGVPRTRYPRRLKNWGLEKHGWHFLFYKSMRTLVICVSILHLCPFNCSSAASFKWKLNEMWSDVKSANIYQPGSEAQNKPFCVGRDSIHDSTVNTKLASIATSFNWVLIKHFLKSKMYLFWRIISSQYLSAQPVRIRLSVPLVLRTFRALRVLEWFGLIWRHHKHQSKHENPQDIWIY